MVVQIASIQRRPLSIRCPPGTPVLYRQPIQLLRQRLRMLPLQLLQRLLLPPPPLLILLMPPLNARRNQFKLLEVAAHRRGRGIQRFLILGPALVGMRLQVRQDEVGVAVEQEVGLRVVALGFVDLRLDVSALNAAPGLRDAPPSAWCWPCAASSPAVCVHCMCSCPPARPARPRWAHCGRS